MADEIFHVRTLNQSPIDDNLIVKIANGEHFVDPHIIGFPIVNFLERYRQAISSRISPLLELINSGGPDSEIKNTYSCVDHETGGVFTISTVSLVKAFSYIRGKLIQKQSVAEFDLLWQQYGMERGMALANEFESGVNVVNYAIEFEGHKAKDITCQRLDQYLQASPSF